MSKSCLVYSLIFCLIFCLVIYLAKCESFGNLQNFKQCLHKYIPFYHHSAIKEKKTLITKELKDVCDENQILLQLARLYATSPERVILLLSTNSISKTCREVSDVLEHINDTVSECVPLPPDNIYKKLNNGLDYFHSYFCLYNSNTRDNHLIKHLPCLAELHEDLLDCEGPPDWFEKSEEAVVCQYYNDIINCNYIKAALLCGLKAAQMLRTFSDEVMKRIVKFKCKISISLPYVDDPMPARACHLKYYINVILFTHCLFKFDVCNYLYAFLIMYISKYL